jgi:hypothetical protein
MKGRPRAQGLSFPANEPPLGASSTRLPTACSPCRTVRSCVRGRNTPTKRARERLSFLSPLAGPIVGRATSRVPGDGPNGSGGRGPVDGLCPPWATAGRARNASHVRKRPTSRSRLGTDPPGRRVIRNPHYVEAGQQPHHPGSRCRDARSDRPPRGRIAAATERIWREPPRRA